jgi:hypothetical protein
MRRKSLGFSEGMIYGMDKTYVEEDFRVFDWDEAARIIKELQPENADAGLMEDWGCTAGEIWRNGQIVPKEDTYTYLGSGWATPLLVLDDDKELECWVYEKDSNFDQHTYWPQSARDILAE